MNRADYSYELKFLPDIEGCSVVVTHTNLVHGVSFARVKEIHSGNSDMTIESLPDDLGYVEQFVRTGCIYVAYASFAPQDFVVKCALSEPRYWNKVVASLESSIIGREMEIMRGHFTKEVAMKPIRNFKRQFQDPEDHDRIDEQKLYYLFLFIYDYVMLTFKECTMNKFLKRYLRTKVTIDGVEYSSSALIDEMLSEYLDSYPYVGKRDQNGDLLIAIEHYGDGPGYIRKHKDNSLYVPEQLIQIVHPACSVMNMVAMFYDMFMKFFVSFGLTRRKGALLSKPEKVLIADLLKVCGICDSGNETTISSMYSKNKDYFKKCDLAITIRDDHYGNLMLNNMDRELFDSGSDAGDIG